LKELDYVIISTKDGGVMLKDYKFTNNGFRIILKPLISLTIVITFIMLIVFIGMLISIEYSYLDALKVLLMIPAVDLIMFIFFSVYFLFIYFTFEIKDNTITVSKWFKKHKIIINDIESIDVSLKFRQQNYIVLKTSNVSVKLLLVGAGGRFMYDEFFKVIDEIKTQIPRIDMSIVLDGEVDDN